MEADAIVAAAALAHVAIGEVKMFGGMGFMKGKNT
jgi:hypothetical protein